MKRVVIDTSVMVAGLRSRSGASFAVLALAARRIIQPVVSIALFLEYEDVLKRREQVEVHGRDQTNIDHWLSEFAAIAEPVDILFQWRPQTSDPDDERVIEAAVNGRADAIITFNLRHIEEAARRFGIPTFRPAEFLMRFAQ